MLLGSSNWREIEGLGLRQITGGSMSLGASNWVEVEGFGLGQIT